MEEPAWSSCLRCFLLWPFQLNRFDIQRKIGRCSNHQKWDHGGIREKAFISEIPDTRNTGMGKNFGFGSGIGYPLGTALHPDRYPKKSIWWCWWWWLIDYEANDDDLENDDCFLEFALADENSPLLPRTRLGRWSLANAPQSLVGYSFWYTTAMLVKCRLQFLYNTAILVTHVTVIGTTQQYW